MERAEILDLVAKAAIKPPAPFIPGITPVNYAGRVYDEAEIKLAVDAVMDFYLTGGKYTHKFENDFSVAIGRKYTCLVNSGSSANLLALSALMSPLLGLTALKPGDEVITVAAGFPTTLNPIIQCGLIPVFVDIDIETLNINVKKIVSAISSNTRAIMIAHTLGNPFNIAAIRKICDDYNLYLVSDNCDALGSVYDGERIEKVGDISTFSFYPAHHITMGEGGCVSTDNQTLAKAIRSLGSWGRSCHCEPGRNNVCGHRFDGQYGNLPQGYDHKYVYSHIGYNLKATEMQAAIGVAQLEKLPRFIERRKENYKIWQRMFIEKGITEYIDIVRPEDDSDPSWFAFPCVMRKDARFTRTDLTTYLAEHKVETRNLFGGNLIKQPAYRKINYKIIGKLVNTDIAMNNAFFLGVYPGMTREMIDYSTDLIAKFVKERG